MSIFGEKCARCGARRTRHEFAGVPTCADCEQRLRAAPEVPRRCPTDSADMVKEVVAGVVIDRCPLCAGVWLDAGELQLLRQAAHNDGVSQAFTSALMPHF